MDSDGDSPLQSEYVLGPDTGTKWVSDTSVFEDTLQHPGNVVIRANPGAGKSYAALERLGAPEHPFIFVADTIASAEDLGSEHDLPVYYAGQPDPGDHDFITIPHHAHKERFTDSDIRLVVDEWHSLLADYGYKGAVIDKLVRAFSEYKQVIGLTGTYLPVPHSHTHVEVTQDRDEISVTVVSYNDLWSAIVEQVEARPDKTHFISLYDKSTRLDNLRALLEDRGFESGEIMSFNSDTTDTEKVQALMEQNATRDDTEVVISTYVQGFSIKDTDYMVHIAPLPGAQHSPTDIAQVAQRFRNTTDLPINLYWNFPPPERTHPTDKERYQTRQEEIANRQLRQYWNELSLEDDENPTSNQKSMIAAHEAMQEKDPETEKDEVNLVRSDLTPNKYQIHHNVYTVITDNIYKRRQAMSDWLGRYGLTVEEEETCPIEFPEVEGGSSTTKTVPEEDFMDRVDDYLERDSIPQTDEAGKKILFLASYYDDKENVRNILEEHGRPTKTWNRLKRKIEAQAPPTELGAKRRDQVLESFDIGEKLTNNEIKRRIEDTGFGDRDSSGLTTRKAVRYLNRYFETQRTTQKRDGKTTSVYEITSQDPLPIPLPEDSKKPRIGEDNIRISPRTMTG